MAKKILFTGVGGDVGESIVRGFLNEPDYMIYGCDIKPFVPYMDQMAKYYVAPKYTSDEYLAFIFSILLTEKVDCFCPTTEPEIILFNKQRDFFNQNNIKLMINNELIIKTCTSKYESASFLKSKNIVVPKTFWASEYNGELEFPVILKPDSGRGSSQVVIVNSMDELKAASESTKNMVVQQYVGSAEEEYTIGVFSDGINIQVISFKRLLGYGGMSVYVELVHNTALYEIAKKISVELELRGSINIQLRKQDDTFYVFEINPRLSSTTGFRHKMGFTDAIWWVNLLLGCENKYIDVLNLGKRVGIKYTDEVVINPSELE